MVVRKPAGADISNEKEWQYFAEEEMQLFKTLYKQLPVEYLLVEWEVFFERNVIYFKVNWLQKRERERERRKEIRHDKQNKDRLFGAPVT